MGMNIKNERVEKLANSWPGNGSDDHRGDRAGSCEASCDGCAERDYATRKARIKEILKRSGPTPPGVTSDHSDLYDEIGLPK